MVAEQKDILDAVVIGTGFSGLCMAIKLKEAGFQRFVVLEKGPEVGGVWRENTYPGAACDIPAELYSFSFAMKTDWSRRYPPQPEIQSYMKECAERFGLYPFIRFNTAVSGARYIEDSAVWEVELAGGEVLRSRILVTGVGQLSRPAMPAIEGLESFAGTRFHSAQWDADFDPAGKRIGVIGTGASAIQFIPELAKSAAQVEIFQRTPPYVMPKPDRAYTALDRWMMKHVPGYKELNRKIWYAAGEKSTGAFNNDSRLAAAYKRLTLWNMRRHIKDPQLRAKLTPDYPIGCKRVLFSHNYFQALAQDNVDVISDPIKQVTAQGLIAGEQSYEFDALIYGTGFRATEFLAPMQISGAQGQQLSEVWADGAEAYKGVSVHGFPNLFMLYGPNTNLGSNSIIFMIECQVGYIMQCVQRLKRGGFKAVDVKAQVMQAYNSDIQNKLKASVWSAGCSSWYHNEQGKVTNNWPGLTQEYKQLLAKLDSDSFDWIGA